MSLPVIDTLRPLGSFPVADSSNIKCGNSMLDTELASKASKTYVDEKVASIKPASGIPKTDLASDVQTSLGKADTALQEHQSLTNYALKSEIPTTLPASDVYPWAKTSTKPTYTKAELGLGSVDNTADADKPVSTATQTALNAKASSESVEAIESRVDTVETDQTALDSRISALEAGTTPEGSEVIGIRTGVDGTLYDTAGDAVRSQVTNVHNRIDNTVGRIGDITGNKFITLESGYAVLTDGATTTLGKVENALMSTAVITCNGGDVFTISGKGGSNARLWAFADSTGKVLSKASANTTKSKLVLKAPPTTSYFIVNILLSSSESFVCKNKYVSVAMDEQNARFGNIVSDISKVSGIKYIDVATEMHIAYSGSAGNPVNNVELSSGCAVEIDVSDYGEAIVIELSDDISNYYKYRLTIADSTKTIAQSETFNDGNKKIYILKDATLKKWTALGYTKAYISVIAYTDDTHSTLKDIPDTAFLTAYYVKHEIGTDIEKKNEYSGFNKYINFKGYGSTFFEGGLGDGITDSHFDYAYGIVFDLETFQNDVTINMSSHFSPYYKVIIRATNGSTINVAEAAITGDTSKVYVLNKHTLEYWRTQGSKTMYVTIMNFSDASYTGTLNLNENAFVEVYCRSVENKDTDFNRMLSVAELPMKNEYDLFVFSGQSNMMGASAIPPTDTSDCLYSYEYLYNPKRLGSSTGQFVHSKHSAGEWSYKDIATAYAQGKVAPSGKSIQNDYYNSCYFVSAMSNKDGDGTVKQFSTYSEASHQVGQSIAPMFAREYASWGNPCVYAHMAQGGVSINHFLNANTKSFFAEKYNSMVADFGTLMTGKTIKSKNFVWCQGESDTSMSVAQYKEKLTELWNWLKTLGFENFFCIRVGYFGETNITKIMKAQEEFCSENDNCYIVTRAMSFMYYPLLSVNFYGTYPTEEYLNCRDSFFGYDNNHINEKGNKLISKRAAKNINLILRGESPELEAENIKALM